MFGRGCKSSEGPSGARAQPALSTPPPPACSLSKKEFGCLQQRPIILKLSSALAISPLPFPFCCPLPWKTIRAFTAFQVGTFWPVRLLGCGLPLGTPAPHENSPNGAGAHPADFNESGVRDVRASRLLCKEGDNAQPWKHGEGDALPPNQLLPNW